MNLAQETLDYLKEIEFEGAEIKAIQDFIEKYNLKNFEHAEIIGNMINALDFVDEKTALVGLKNVFLEEIVEVYLSVKQITEEKGLREELRKTREFSDEIIDLENPKFSDEEVLYINETLKKDLNSINIKDIINNKYFFYISGFSEYDF